MRRLVASACSVVVAASLGVAMDVTAAHATASGESSFVGKLVVHTTDTGARDVLASVIRFRGVVNATGHIVERDNLPGDGPNVNRDDLVFPEGTLSLVNTLGDSDFNLDPRSCIARIETPSTSVIDHGTGIFANASGTMTGTGTTMALAARAPDGSCSLEQPPIFEMDNVAASGNVTI